MQLLWLIVFLLGLGLPVHGVKRKIDPVEIGPFAKKIIKQYKANQDAQCFDPPGHQSSASCSAANPLSSASSSLPASSSTDVPRLSGSSFKQPLNLGSQAVISDVYLSNKLSAKDVSLLAVSIYRDGNLELKSLASAGNWGANPKHLAKAISKRLVKGCLCPEPFWRSIHLWDHAKQSQVMLPCPFLLPHEVLHSLVSTHGIDFTRVRKGAMPELHEHVHRECSKYRLDQARTVAMGIHGDGVPYTKKESLEMISWNFIAQPTFDRVPFTGISKKHLCQCGCKGFHTWHAALNIMKWMEPADVVYRLRVFFFARWQCVACREKAGFCQARNLPVMHYCFNLLESGLCCAACSTFQVGPQVVFAGAAKQITTAIPSRIHLLVQSGDRPDTHCMTACKCSEMLVSCAPY